MRTQVCHQVSIRKIAGHARIATICVRRFRAACFAVQDVAGRTTGMGLERSTSEQSIVANLEAVT